MKKLPSLEAAARPASSPRRAPKCGSYFASDPKSGSWTSFTDSRIPGTDNSTSWSESTGAEIQFSSVTGNTLVLRYITNTNAGFAFVALDGSYTNASMSLPAVQSSDLKAISDVTNPNAPSAGPIRITAPSHGLTSGRMLVEGVTGVAAANGYQIVSVLDANTLDLVGPTFSGSYSGGGTIGYFGSADIGKRYVSMYSGLNAYHDEQMLIAEGITDGPHSVWLKPAGTASGGAGNYRIYVTGVAGASHDMTPDQGTDYSVVYLREPNNLRATGAQSAMVSALWLTNSDLLGEIHGFESQLAQCWYIDEKPLAALAAGQYASGTLIRNALRTTLWHSAVGNAVWADKSSDYFFSAYQRDGCRVVSNVTWRQPGIGKYLYYGMLPIARLNRNAVASPFYRNDEFDQIYFGSTSVGGLGNNNDGWDGETWPPAEKATFYHSTTAHPLRARLRIDKAKNVNNWAAAPAIHFSSQDRSDGLDKVYAARCNNTGQEIINAGDVHRSDTGFHVFRQSDTNPDSEQDT